jgi:hypothetical protein
MFTGSQNWQGKKLLGQSAWRHLRNENVSLPHLHVCAWYSRNSHSRHRFRSISANYQVRDKIQLAGEVVLGVSYNRDASLGLTGLYIFHRVVHGDKGTKRNARLKSQAEHDGMWTTDNTEGGSFVNVDEVGYDPLGSDDSFLSSC